MLGARRKVGKVVGGEPYILLLFHNFKGLSRVKGKARSSPAFSSFGNGCVVDLYPGEAKAGYISVFLRTCPGPEISIQF
jgi:hypothetical protein